MKPVMRQVPPLCVTFATDLIHDGDHVDTALVEVERMIGVRATSTLKRMSFERKTGRAVIALSVGQTRKAREKYVRFFLELNSVVSVK